MEKRTITNITIAANTKIKTITMIATAFISLYIINHVTLYIIKKATNHGIILKKNKKSPKLNLRLLTETSLVSRLASRRSDPIDQATIRGYVLSRLRRGEEEEVCTGGRAKLYTC